MVVEVLALTANGAAAKAAELTPTFCKKDLLLDFIGALGLQLFFQLQA